MARRQQGLKLSMMVIGVGLDGGGWTNLVKTETSCKCERSEDGPKTRKSPERPSDFIDVHEFTI